MRFFKWIGLGLAITAFFYFLTFFAKTGDRLPQPDWAVDERPLELYLINAHSELVESLFDENAISIDLETRFQD